MNEDLINFRESIDGDAGLQSKRRILVAVCVTFLALNLSGATLGEANTFIFKITFTNHLGLSYLFVASIVFMVIRYYSYAQNYHNRLYEFWTQRLLNDHLVFRYDHHKEEVSGLLGKAVNVWGGDEPGISKPTYCYTGFLKRSLAYMSEGLDEERGPFSYTEYIALYKFTDKWRLKDYLHLIWFESQYQVEYLLKYRECLDLFAPYLLALSAILSFIFKGEVLSWLSAI